MTLEELKNQLPEYAKDLKLNLSSIMNSQELPKPLLWGSLLVAALASHNQTVIATFHNEAKNYLNEQEITAVKAAAAIMAMNNIYYRFTHLIGKNEYASLPAGLRMNIMANPGVEKKDFEFWSFIVSAINGCAKCLDAHEAELLKNGMNINMVQVGARIAAVIHGIARTIDIEEAIKS